MPLPRYLYSAAQVRELDRRASRAAGLPAGTLMQRAGESAWRVLRARYPRARQVAVVCGPGNNGGDGYVLARLAHSAGLAVRVLALGDPARLTGDARGAHAACTAAGLEVRAFAAAPLAGCDVIVDALLGTGLERPVSGEFAAAIAAINAARVPVLAIDIASGLHADSGRVLGAAVKADATVSFIGLKFGLFTGAGREHSGAILFDDLGVPAEVYRDVPALAERLEEAALASLLPQRARDAHKGSSGHVLVIGGTRGMPGAARMAGEAAYRAGAGRVTVATHPAHAAALNAARPELIVHAVEDARDLAGLLARADCVALGPGIGRDAWARALVASALAGRAPLVVDADALHLLAADALHREDWVLTPHPGEAARLIGAASAAAVQDDRLTALHAITARYGGSCVLKGSGTLVATHREPQVYLCDRGNPGMASAGMGDVLTGIIAALIAQGLDGGTAARLGVWLHAAAADAAAAAAGEVGLLATDLLGHLRALINRRGLR